MENVIKVIIMVSIFATSTEASGSPSFIKDSPQNGGMIHNQSDHISSGITALVTTKDQRRRLMTKTIFNCSSANYSKSTLQTCVKNNICQHQLAYAIYQEVMLRGSAIDLQALITDNTGIKYVYSNGEIHKVYCQAIQAQEIEANECFQDGIKQFKVGNEIVLVTPTGFITEYATRRKCHKGRIDDINYRMDQTNVATAGISLISNALYLKTNLKEIFASLFSPSMITTLLLKEEADFFGIKETANICQGLLWIRRAAPLAITAYSVLCALFNGFLFLKALYNRLSCTIALSLCMNPFKKSKDFSRLVQEKKTLDQILFAKRMGQLLQSEIPIEITQYSEIHITNLYRQELISRKQIADIQEELNQIKINLGITTELQHETFDL